ncbi:MAG TPA: hypothetical protein DD490_28125, partial [Acidobacteria bacterium]|nr:hypothetical protein [Acidobacteriota bacterium]
MHRDDILLRDPAAQLVSLPDGRVVARHAAGLSVLRGVTAGDLQRLLDLADGTRTAEDLCTALQDEYDPAAVRGLLEHLTGDLLRVVPPEKPVLPVHLAASGAAARRLAAGLGLAFDPPVPLLDARLALAVREEASYGELLELQSLWLGAEVASLFVTAD